MRINTNIASLNAQANAANTNKSLTSSLEKLSSGLRINKAADDASGMAIADKLRTQASSIGQGIANANSGSALIQIADKALGEQSSILDTVKTKLIQATTSTTSSEGREAIRKDITKLLEQFDNIAEQTTYNGINLLNEEGSEFNFQLGERATDQIGFELSKAVNTESLGSEATLDRDATGTMRFTGIAGTGNVAIEDTGDANSVTVQTTGGDGMSVVINADTLSSSAGNVSSNITQSIAGDAAFTVDATKVQSISLSTTAASATVTIKTDDADMQQILDALVHTADTAADGVFTRIGEGSYTFTTSGAGLASTLTFAATAEDGIDLNKLKFSGVAQAVANSSGDGNIIQGAEVLSIRTNEEVTITKDGGTADLGIGASTHTGFIADGGGASEAKDLFVTSPSDNTEMTYKSAFKLTEGTTSVQVDPNNDKSTDLTVENASIGINLLANADVSDTSFTVNSTNVESIKLKTGATDTGEVKLSTTNEDLADTLKTIANTNTHLTANDDGTFTLKATSATTEAVIDFGDTPVDIEDLKFDEVQQHTAANRSEKVYIETADAVTITNNKEGAILGIDGSDGTDNIAGAAATHVDMLGADTSNVVVSSKLDGLAQLGEDELTAEKANEMMEVIDNALNQLNAVRADFGSTQNQLQVATRSMMVTQVNIKAAESVIRDVDYAAESASFNKQNIIAQAGTYAMSQANAMAQNVQKLLQ